MFYLLSHKENVFFCNFFLFFLFNQFHCVALFLDKQILLLCYLDKQILLLCLLTVICKEILFLLHSLHKTVMYVRIQNLSWFLFLVKADHFVFSYYI